MLGSGVLEVLVTLVLAVIGGSVIFGQIKENAKRNEEDINSIKKMLHDYQESMLTLLTKNMEDMKQLLDREKNNSREAWQNEISHLRELVNINANETRADIQRLQIEQEKSNNIKTKVALLSSSVKALHHRLDLESPIMLNDVENED